MQGVLPNAALFLSVALPWPVEGGPQFQVNIHRKVQRTEKDKPQFNAKGEPVWWFPGRGTATVAQATNYIQFKETQATADTYVCMSGQMPGELVIGKGNRSYHRAARSLDGAVLMKGLWLDVDVKPDNPAKGYASTEAAVAEFGRIRRTLGLPVPTVCVLSGSGGFHAHWCFPEGIPPDVWAPIAHALVAAYIAQGFKGDTGCTIDAARLLRVPDTWNHKQVHAGTGPLLPVGILAYTGNTYPVEYIRNILQPYIGTAPVFARKALLNLGSMPAHIQALRGLHATDLSAGLDQRPAPSIVDVAKVCPFINQSLAEGGKSNNQPLWMMTGLFASFMKEGRDAMHWMSQGHVTYNPAETEEMWLRKQDERLRKNMGWPKCSTIASEASVCQTCPHKDKGKSPFNFVEHNDPVNAAVALATAPPIVDPAAVAAMAPLPVGYSYGPNGTIWKESVDSDGKIEKVQAIHFPMLRPWMQDHPAYLNFTTITAGTPGQPDAFERQIKVPLNGVHDVTAMAKLLADQHMVVAPNDVADFRGFMVSWIETLRKNRENIVQSAPFGWFRPDGKVTGFIYAKQVWTDRAPRPASNPDPVLERQYMPNGELEPWLTASKMITDQNRPEFDAILASAFAAPLVGCVGQTGLLMSTYSPESGIGKSTALRVAQAVWGHPVKAIQSLGDTQNSVIKKMGDIRSLPMYWDELKTDADHAKFVALAFQLAQGKEKSRMASDTSYREPGTWETMLVSASNDSLINYITGKTRTTSAGIARIFEYRVAPGKQGRIDIAVAQNIIAALNDNYGQAGLVYAKFLGREAAVVHAETAALLLELEKTFTTSTEERFWLALVAVILQGAKYANRLKLTKIHEANLRRFMFDQFDQMRKERKMAPVDITDSGTLLDHLSRYLNVKRVRHTVTTNIIWVSPGRPPVGPGGVLMKMDPNNKLEEPNVHFGTDDHRLRLVKQPFIEWLRDNDLSDRLILQELTKQFGMIEIKGRVGVGTPYQTQSEPVLDFDTRHPGFSSWQ